MLDRDFFWGGGGTVRYKQAWVVVASLLWTACSPGDKTDDDVAGGDATNGEDTDTDNGETDATGDESGDETGGDDGPVSLDVDVVFVVDNSGQFGPNMAPLAAGLDDFVDVLEDEGFNYRIAFTTTDNGNPLCGVTPPEGGQFRAISCLDRLDEFVFNGVETTIDYTQTCQDACSSQALTTTDGNPWIDVSEGTANLPEGTNVAEAMRCFGLQGITGCGMESPLGCAQRSVERAAAEDEPEFGFFREGSTVAFVFATDEYDCSFNPMWASIFDPDGEKVFWTDPTERATSGICWNAGVTCTGGPGTYDRCDSENKDIEGNLGVTDDESVLIPVPSLISTFEELREGGSHRLVVAGLVGVPEGYSTGSAEIPYANSPDEEFQWLYGIGPGCSQSSEEVGLPPVRLREFADFFAEPGARHLYSICAADYGPALSSIAETIRERARG